jgi:hypothetical protein
MNAEQWSQDIAVLAADALVDAQIIAACDMPRAIEIIAEEIWVRLNRGLPREGLKVTNVQAKRHVLRPNNSFKPTPLRAAA